ncbi:MAG: hypothetical protein IT441_10495 [Phycisphaeraceae bacterium]|nr:hypothetical protein [Phycisphaeraceae bacterium]
MGTTATPLRALCPHCHHSYKWKPELADRKARCKHCEKSFVVPHEPPLDHNIDQDQPAAKPRHSHSSRSRTAERTHRSSADSSNRSRGAGKTARMKIKGGKLAPKDDPNPYDIDDPEEAKKAAAAKTEPCISCKKEVKVGAVICVHCGYNRVTKQKPGEKKSGGLFGLFGKKK